MQTHYTHYIIL